MLVTKRLRLKWFIKIDGWAIAFFLLYSTTLCMVYLTLSFGGLAFPIVGIGTFGTAVAILLGFRNNSAYDRFWEARTAWGDLTNASRNFASQVMAYIRPPKGSPGQASEMVAIHREVLYRHLAYVNALRLQLRDETRWAAIEPFLSQADLERLDGVRNKATQLNHQQSERLRQLHADGWIGG